MTQFANRSPSKIWRAPFPVTPFSGWPPPVGRNLSWISPGETGASPPVQMAMGQVVGAVEKTEIELLARSLWRDPRADPHPGWVEVAGLMGEGSSRASSGGKLLEFAGDELIAILDQYRKTRGWEGFERRGRVLDILDRGLGLLAREEWVSGGTFGRALQEVSRFIGDFRPLLLGIYPENLLERLKNRGLTGRLVAQETAGSRPPPDFGSGNSVDLAFFSPQERILFVKIFSAHPGERDSALLEIFRSHDGVNFFAHRLFQKAMMIFMEGIANYDVEGGAEPLLKALRQDIRNSSFLNAVALAVFLHEHYPGEYLHSGFRLREKFNAWESHFRRLYAETPELLKQLRKLVDRLPRLEHQGQSNPFSPEN